MTKIAASLGAVLLAPFAIVMSIAVLAAGAVGTDAGAAAAAAAACTYGNPDPARISLTMEQLSDPVDEVRYNEYAPAAGIDPAAVPFTTSTAAQRHDVLVAGIRSIWYTTTPRTVATPVVVWWNGELPVDDTDVAWQDTTVPGYGTLNDYLEQYLNEYAVNPTVLASVTSASCTPSTGICEPPDDLSPILATIRTLESGGDYTAQAAGSTASGAYQFIDSTWDGFAGYRRAYLAPPPVQDQKATILILDVLTAHGNDVAAIPVVWYIGHLPDDSSSEWDTVPALDAGNVLTPRQYQTRWVTEFLEIAGDNADTCPAAVGFTNLAGPDCDGLRGSGATYNGKVNGTLSTSDLQASQWGPLQPAAAAGWAALVQEGQTAGFPPSAFQAWSGGPGSRNGGTSNHTIGLALDINQLAWTPTRSVPGERLPVPYVFDEPFYSWLRNNSWRFGWCNPRWARPYYLNGTSTGGRDAAGNGNHLEPWHFEFVGGSDHYMPYEPADLNGPLGVAD